MDRTRRRRPSRPEAQTVVIGDLAAQQDRSIAVAQDCARDCQRRAAQQSRNPYPASFHLFAKGDRGEKLILVAVDGDRYNTLYRLRALLASLTAVARSTPVFLDQDAPENLTFLDLCKMLGVARLTVTDGNTVAHQFEIR